jgi:hypothetical protein
MRMNFFAAGLLLDTGGLDQEYEGARTPVHDRHLAGTDVHVGIVDAETGHRRQQVLDRGHALPSCTSVVDRVVSPTFAAQAGISTTGSRSTRRNTIPRIDRRRRQGQVDLLARMQADARRLDGVAQRPLSNHTTSLSPPPADTRSVMPRRRNPGGFSPGAA